MTPVSRRDTKREGARIRLILNRDWDPIGGIPEDEYDFHIWPLYALLTRSAPRAEIEDYLRWAADVHITCPLPEERLQHVVGQLLGLGLG